MAQPGITAKIEELQFRIKTDPKSRLFFPLAEELRKNGKLAEAEQVLRTGLGVHPTYLSAWVSLGRVLREQHKNAEAVDALTKALQVDPGNVVAARLLGDSYLDLGEKVEAIKKYKLVHALMPGDEELETRIELLDRELRPAPEPEPEPVAAMPESPFAEPEPVAAEPESPFAEAEPEPVPEPEPQPEPVFSATADVPFAPPESLFDETSPIHRTIETPFDTDDEIPMSAQHAESPFEEPSGYTADALAIEQPEGMHIEEAPLVAEVPTIWSEEPRESELVADVFAPAEPEPSAPDDDLTATTTMADLYVRQGLIEDARKIYEHMLERDPSNDELRSKLDALGERVAGLPGDQVAETTSLDSETESAATWQLGNPATESSATQQLSNPATEPPATWQPGNPATEYQATDDEERHPGNPATLHSHAKVVVLEQWLAKVAKRESQGA
jgi:pentatricopeptide repeat protein